MKVSFVIPAYNEERLIGDCLKSVIAEIARNECLAEIIVVNNASTDKTREAAEKFEGVKVIDEPNKGLVKARHRGFLESCGALVANIDSDMTLPEGWLKKVLFEFEKSPMLIALSGPQVYYDMTNLVNIGVRFFYYAAYGTYFFNRHILRKGSMLQGGNFIIKRSALEEIGGYDTSIEFYGEETHIAQRLAKIGPVKFTMKLPIYASGRRFKDEGIIPTAYRYALNYFWVLFFKKPFHQKYTDVRPDK